MMTYEIAFYPAEAADPVTVQGVADFRSLHQHLAKVGESVSEITERQKEGRTVLTFASSGPFSDAAEARGRARAERLFGRGRGRAGQAKAVLGI